MTKLLENYLTEAEAANELDKHVRTLQIWRAQRAGPDQFDLIFLLRGP